MPLYTARGFKSFYLGDEAIIDCDTFTLEGSAMKSVRAAVRKVGRTYSFQLMSEAQGTAELVRQLNAISEKWRGKAPERGFTMSLSQDIEGVGRNAEFLLCVALGRERRARRVPAHRAGVRAAARLHPRPDAARPRRAERDDRVPDRLHARSRSRTAAWIGCR